MGGFLEYRKVRKRELPEKEEKSRSSLKFIKCDCANQLISWEINQRDQLF